MAAVPREEGHAPPPTLPTLMGADGSPYGVLTSISAASSRKV